MTNQNCIGRALRAPEGMERLAGTLAAGRFETRTELGRPVGSDFGFSDALGRPQEASCTAVLRELAKALAGESGVLKLVSSGEM